MAIIKIKKWIRYDDRHGEYIFTRRYKGRNYTSCGCRRGASKAYMDSIRDPERLKTTRPTAKSTTGVRGVYYRKNRGVYQAFINVDKKPKYLGSSKDFEKAVALRKAAEIEYGYHDK